MRDVKGSMFDPWPKKLKRTNLSKTEIDAGQQTRMKYKHNTEVPALTQYELAYCTMHNQIITLFHFITTL